MSKKVKREQFVLCAHYNAQAFVKQTMQVDVFNTDKKTAVMFKEIYDNRQNIINNMFSDKMKYL